MSGSDFMFTPIGSGGSSASSGTGKNYLGTVNNVNLNGDFETALSAPWELGTVTLTSGLPTGAPSFGSGASGNLSFSAVSSGKLAGSYSGALVSSAATTAGNMLHSSAFTLDLEDRAKVMTIGGYYSPTVNPTNANWSGTSSNSFGLAVYDVTNSTWIIPAGVFSMTQGSGVGRFTATFQTSATGASYRFVIYNANATSGAITVLFDDLYLGPQTAAIGPIVTDWVSWTPTGTWVSNATYVGRKRRVGDKGEYQVSITTSAAPTSAQLYVSMPSGEVIDTTKLSGTVNNVAVGFGATTDTGTSGYPVVVTYDTTTRVAVTATGSASTYVNTAGLTQVIPFTFGNTDTVDIQWTVPIVGWSSNVQMSNDTDTRVVAATLGTGTGTLSGSDNVVKFTATVFDTHAAYSASTGLYTCPVSGYYEIASNLDIQITSASGKYLNVSVYKSGVSAYSRENPQPGTTTNLVGSINTIIQCNAGDTLGIYSNTNGASGSFTAGTAPYYNFLSIKRLSGPAVVAATESVAALYTGGPPTGTLTSAYNTTTYATKVQDTHNAYSSGTYTVPVSGTYNFSAANYQNATYAINKVAVVAMAINGTALYKGVQVAAAAVSNLHIICTVNGVRLNAGDLVTVKSFNDATTPTFVNDASLSWFSITRVGN